MFSISRPPTPRIARPVALTTPVETVERKPSGLPMAITSWPTRRASLSPSSAYGRSRAARRTRARSVVRVVADELGVEAVAVFGHRGELLAAAGDVAVGQRVAVGREQHAGALPAAGFAARAFDAETVGPKALDHADDGAGVGVEQFQIARGGGVALGAGGLRAGRPLVVGVGGELPCSGSDWNSWRFVRADIRGGDSAVR